MPLISIHEGEIKLDWRIDAPRARVWQCITDPDLLSQWLGVLVEGIIAPGSTFVVDHGDEYCCRSVVESYAEPNKLGFTWHFADEPPSRVGLGLEEAEGATELRLSHRALGDLAESYVDGWCTHLSYLEAAALGTPLPASMFWRLHGTIAQLRNR
ncbi:SRPBCC family protein [Tessaracoccus oleiagri]|uniref:Uncharacterized conserved protein YndB, AHSA1/START domain n=1 Tax=Tessaracoccus oleiagri TaxID=686624 RepID=A0A1G9JSP2_9ACTN|nr:SRPBCC domain-containing protein [Tessaracoccus oleiagri]SDL40471.1 Uncharacterized conserved protein YndB, AHSA1/START domain [Tessaracoccus oleiagri]